MVISCVRDFTEGAIRLEQRVLSLHYISISALVLRFVVSGVRIFHGVRVVVFRVGLKI